MHYPIRCAHIELLLQVIGRDDGRRTCTRPGPTAIAHLGANPFLVHQEDGNLMKKPARCGLYGFRWTVRNMELVVGHSPATDSSMNVRKTGCAYSCVQMRKF